MKSKSVSKWYWLTGASLFLVMMINCGVGYYSLSLFVSPIAADYCISAGDVAMLYSFYSLGSAVAAFSLSKVLMRYSLRTLIIFGGIISTLGYINYYFSTSLPWMYIGGTLIGASTVYAGTATVQIGIAHWFEKKRSVVTGIIAAASGVGTAIGSPIIGTIIRDFGWRCAFALIGCLVFFLVSTQAFFLFFGDPVDKSLCAYGAGESGKKIEAVSQNCEGMRLNQAKNHTTFYLFIIGLLMTSIVYQTISLYQSSILLEKGFSEELTASCLSVFAVADMLSKMSAGVIAENRGFKTVTTYCSIAVITALCLIRTTSSSLGAFGFSALLGFWPTILVLYGVTVSIDLYGKQHLTEYISFTQTTMCCCSVIGMPIIRELYNSVNSFEVIMNIVIICAAIFMIDMLLLLQKKNLYSSSLKGHKHQV